MSFLTLSDTDINFLIPSGAPMEDLYHQGGPSNYQARRTSGSERVVAAELDPEHEIYIVHVRSVNSNVLPSFTPGSYKGFYQVCRLCVLSKLDFQTPQAY